ncbi:hypothetical protein VTK73DRAFT_2785 [Phialemonium thermophilum]|uniref:Uncharacterized protein n=1 Tax=Phialemonium thermophilum TaxID=223376 RepID=A0ABR3X3E8_9PEZI
MANGPAPADKTVLLDYVTILKALGVRKAARNGDGLVVCTASASLALMLLVILSTALIAPSVLTLEAQSIPVTTQTAFVDDTAGLLDAESLSFYEMLGNQQMNVTFPSGIAARFSYQQFATDFPADTAVQVTVDGLSVDLDCKAAQLVVSGVQFDGSVVLFDVSLDVPGCSVVTSIQSTTFLPDLASNDTDQLTYFARFGQGSCGTSTDAHDQRVVVMFGVEAIDRKSIPDDLVLTSIPITGAIAQSTRLLCIPTYNISRINISRNGTDLLGMEPLGGASTGV